MGSIAFSPAAAPDVLSRLHKTLSAYHGHPSAELAQHVLEAFSAIDGRLADLRTRAAASAGGTRAELVIERIELERERDAQMQRFSAANARAKAGAGDGGDALKFATSMLGSSLGGK